MNFVDRIVVQLANDGSRASIFDEPSLEQLVSAAYDTTSSGLEGPYRPTFDYLEIGYSLQPLVTVEGSWKAVDASVATDARFRLAGLTAGPPMRVDALWHGAIVARAVLGTDQIDAATTNWPTLGAIDQEIESALGVLPNNSVALESERRTRLVGHIRQALGEPGAFTNGAFDNWLASVGASSVADLLTRYRASLYSFALKVRFSAPPAGPSVPVICPIAAALLVRETIPSVTGFLAESKSLRAQLKPLGIERPRTSPLPVRFDTLTVWIVPESVFDDADWPGGEGLPADQARARRRREAGNWLAREGIGLVAVDD